MKVVVNAAYQGRAVHLSFAETTQTIPMNTECVALLGVSHAGGGQASCPVDL